jgi:hypothetical protein
MRARVAEWLGTRALWATLLLALSLAVAPVIEGIKHSPTAIAAEADHRAYHAEQGSAHDIVEADHHDAGDHDHFGAAVLASPGAEVFPSPQRTLRPETLAADGTIRAGPRRPPRLMMI